MDPKIPVCSPVESHFQGGCTATFNWARHGGKRHVMVPGGHVMAENDTSWESKTTGIRCRAALIWLQGDGGQAVIR